MLIVVVVPVTVKSPEITVFPNTSNPPPTFKFLEIPTPPATLRAPVVLLVLSVVSLIVAAPSTLNVLLADNVVNAPVLGAEVPIAVLSIEPESILTLGIIV